MAETLPIGWVARWYLKRGIALASGRAPREPRPPQADDRSFWVQPVAVDPEETIVLSEDSKPVV